MSVSSVGTTNASAYTQQVNNTKGANDAKETTNTSSTKKDQNTAAVYEKSTAKTGYTKKSNSAVVAKMKAEAEQRTSQLQSLVEKMISKQGQTLGTADSIWSFLAKGNFTADPETIAQAKKDIASDGYWGAEQTSDRILSFAKALAGDDPDKAEELLNAFKKGYAQATGTWGKELPSLCSDTYDLVEEKFNKWMEGTEVEG